MHCVDIMGHRLLTDIVTIYFQSAKSSSSSSNVNIEADEADVTCDISLEIVWY